MEERDGAGWLIPSRAYDVLKWAGLIALPALATLVGTCGVGRGRGDGPCGRDHDQRRRDVRRRGHRREPDQGGEGGRG